MIDELQNETEQTPAPEPEDEEARLLEEVPELTEVPEEARRLAAERGISLLDAYLRFCHEERRRARAEEERAARAAAQSAGSLFAAAVRPQPEQEAFARAFRDALGR